MGRLKTLPSGARLTKGTTERVLSQAAQSHKGKVAVSKTLSDVDEELARRGKDLFETLQSVAKRGRQTGRVVQNTVDEVIKEVRVLTQKSVALFQKRNAKRRATPVKDGKKPAPSPVKFARVDQSAAAGSVLDRPLGGPAAASTSGVPTPRTGKDLEAMLMKQAEEFRQALIDKKVPDWEAHYQLRLKHIRTAIAAQKKAEDILELIHDAFAAAKPMEKLMASLGSFHDEHKHLLSDLARRLASVEESRAASQSAQAAVDQLKKQGLKLPNVELKKAQAALKSAMTRLTKAEKSYGELAKPLTAKLRGRFKSVWQAGVKRVFTQAAEQGALFDVALRVDDTGSKVLKSNQVGIAIELPDSPDLILTKRKSGWVSISLRMYEVEVKLASASQDLGKLSVASPQELLQRTGRFVDVGLDFDHALTSFDAAFRNWVKTGDVNALKPIVDPAGMAMSTRLSNQGVFNTLRGSDWSKSAEVSLADVRKSLPAGETLHLAIVELGDGELARQKVVKQLSSSLSKAGAEVDEFELRSLVQMLPDSMWEAK